MCACVYVCMCVCVCVCMFVFVCVLCYPISYIGLAIYKHEFMENEINGEALLHMVHEDIVTEMKIKKVGHVKKILLEIDKLR